MNSSFEEYEISKKQSILYMIERLSNLDFQMNIWVAQKHWDRALDFGETVNVLDDYCFFDDVETNAYNLSQECDYKLKRFAMHLLSYSDNINPENMMKDNSWLNVVEEAKVTYEILKSKWENLKT